MLFLSDNQNRNHSLQRGLPVNRPISFVAAAQSRRIPKLLIATTDLAIGQKSTSISNADILSFNNSVGHHRLHEKHTWKPRTTSLSQSSTLRLTDTSIDRNEQRQPCHLRAYRANPFNSSSSLRRSCTRFKFADTGTSRKTSTISLANHSLSWVYSLSIRRYGCVPKDLDHLQIVHFPGRVLTPNSRIWVRP